MDEELMVDDTEPTTEPVEGEYRLQSTRSTLEIDAQLSSPDGVVEFRTEDRATTLRLSRALFAALGRPAKLTISVEPGDRPAA